MEMSPQLVDQPVLKLNTGKRSFPNGRCKAMLSMLYRAHYFQMLRAGFLKWNNKGICYHQLKEIGEEQRQELSISFDMLSEKLSPFDIGREAVVKKYDRFYGEELGFELHSDRAVIKKMLAAHQSIVRLIEQIKAQPSMVAQDSLTSFLQARLQSHLAHKAQWEGLLKKYALILS